MLNDFCRQIRKYILAFIIVVTSLTFIVASKSTLAASYRISTNKTKIEVGKRITLKLIDKKSKKYANKIKVKWNSSNKKVAAVNSKGIVKGKKEGNAKIIAVVGRKKYICKVNVKKRVDKKPESTATAVPTPTINVSNVVLATPTPIPLDNIIIHRGKGSAPENSITAVEQAVQSGYGCVEIDIHFTSDNVPVIIHDSKLDRLCNGKGLVSELTYDEIKQYDFGFRKGESYLGTRISTLEQMVAFAMIKKCGLYLEIKPYMLTNEQVSIIYNILKKYDAFGKMTFISFSKYSLEALRVKMPGLRYGYLTNDASDPNNIDILREIGKIVGGEVFLNVDVNNAKYSSDAVRKVKAAGYKVEGWTFYDPVLITDEHRQVLSGFTCNF